MRAHEIRPGDELRVGTAHWDRVWAVVRHGAPVRIECQMETGPPVWFDADESVEVIRGAES